MNPECLHEPAQPRPDGSSTAAESVESRLRQLTADVGLLQELVQDYVEPAAPGEPGLPAGAAAMEPAFSALEDWVVEHFAPMYARPLGPAVRWCPQWWDHAEAISRLEALWRSWEAARTDPLRGIATWYRDYLDPQLAILLGTPGPFAQCTPDRHAPVKPLPSVPAPDGYWDPEPEGQPLEQGSPYRDPGAPA